MQRLGPLSWSRLLLCAPSSAGDGQVGRSKFTRKTNAQEVKGSAKFRENKSKERAKFRSKARHGTIIHQMESIASSMASVTDVRELQLAQVADNIFARGGSFIASACNIAFIPDGNPATPEVAFAGRWDTGRTALLRSIFKNKYPVNQTNNDKRKEAINYYNVADVFNIAELPGFGGTHVPFHVVLQHASLLRNFVRCRPSLKMLYYCMDVHKISGISRQDMDMLKFMAQEIPNFTIVVTKSDRHQGYGADQQRQMQADEIADSSDSPYQDRMTASQPDEFQERKFTIEDIMGELRHNGIHHPVLVTSAFRMAGIDVLRYDMVQSCLHALPTGSLTLTEARKLSQRLFTMNELSAVRPIPLPLTHIEEEEHYWRRELAGEDLLEAANTTAHQQQYLSTPSSNDDLSAAASLQEQQLAPSENDDFVDPDATTNGNDGSLYQNQKFDVQIQVDDDVIEEEDVSVGSTSAQKNTTKASGDRAEVEIASAPHNTVQHITKQQAVLRETGALRLSTDDASDLVQQFQADADSAVEKLANARERSDNADNRRHSLMSLNKKLQNKELLQYVTDTSPWRNAALWPPHVLPTKNLRFNVVRNAQDPTNPYLTQSRFVAPRMDMYFRRPNVPTLCANTVSQRAKGSYYLNSSLKKLEGPYTIPYFPEIVDVDIHADSTAFVGAKDYNTSMGKVVGLLAADIAAKGRINPLSANPAPDDAHLTAEVKKLEDKRYAESGGGGGGALPDSTPKKRIAFLKPVDDE